MPKDKKPRRRRQAPSAETPAPPPAAPEVLPAPAPTPRAQVPAVESGRQAEPAAFVAQIASVVRSVAIALIDFADAAAEAVTKRLEA